MKDLELDYLILILLSFLLFGMVLSRAGDEEVGLKRGDCVLNSDGSPTMILETYDDGHHESCFYSMSDVQDKMTLICWKRLPFVYFGKDETKIDCPQDAKLHPGQLFYKYFSEKYPHLK